MMAAINQFAPQIKQASKRYTYTTYKNEEEIELRAGRGKSPVQSSPLTIYRTGAAGRHFRRLGLKLKFIHLRK